VHILPVISHVNVYELC